MLIAAFCLFAPAALSLGLRRWLWGRESTGEALMHFGTAALWLNALALALLDARFHVEVPVVQALSQSGLFALKYLALTCALALGGELAEATILERIGDNRYLAVYNGIKCSAIYNPFVNRFYVDDVYGVMKERPPKSTDTHNR